MKNHQILKLDKIKLYSHKINIQYTEININKNRKWFKLNNPSCRYNTFMYIYFCNKANARNKFVISKK